MSYEVQKKLLLSLVRNNFTRACKFKVGITVLLSSFSIAVLPNKTSLDDGDMAVEYLKCG